MRISALVEDPSALRTLGLALRRDDGVRRTCSLHVLSSLDDLMAGARDDDWDAAFIENPFPFPGSSGLNALRALEWVHRKLGPGTGISFICSTSNPTPPPKDLVGLRFPIVLVKGADDDTGSILRALARAKIHRLVGGVSQEPSGPPGVNPF